MIAKMGSQFAAAALLMTGLIALAIPANCNSEGNILYAQRMAWPQTLTAMESWDPTLDNPCLWEYVICDHENRVTHLDLGNVGISGPLVPELGDLEKLQYLMLFKNALNGSIPTTLGNLSNLVSLDLQDNQFSGTIPDSLGTISTLKNINVENNNVTCIPISRGLRSPNANVILSFLLILSSVVLF